MTIINVFRYILSIFILCGIILVGCSTERGVTFNGKWNGKDKIRPEWFGAVNDGQTDCSEAIQKMFDFMASNGAYTCKFEKCDFEKGKFYLISKTINIRKPVRIEGEKAFISSKTIIPYGNDPNHKSFLSDGVAFYFWGDEVENPKITDICINIKVHAKPFFFYKLKNAYIHDCYVSTFTGDTSITKGVYTFWYAFQCVNLVNAKFKNVHIDQPTNELDYNSADGIHLSGKCHDVIIDNVYGQSGDDFIAMNTNENISGDIYNITIKNCTIGKDKRSGSGIRFYGCSRLSHVPGKPQLSINNVSIENCFIRSGLSPCIFFTNNPDWKYTDTTSLKLAINDVKIKNCTLDFLSIRKTEVPSVWIDGIECNNLVFDRIRSVVDTENMRIVEVKDYNDINSLRVKRSRQNGKKVLTL